MKQPTAKQIKAARLKLGMTQAQAAQVIHKTFQAWSHWELGVRNMPLDSWELWNMKMANELGRLERP